MRSGPLSIFGITLLVFFIIGSISYSYCCSYHPRNGWWVIGILTGSVLCQLLSVKKFKLPLIVNNQSNCLWNSHFFIPIFGILFILGVVFFLSYYEIKDKEVQLRYKNYDPTKGSILKVLKPNDIVVSTFQPLGFLEPFKKSIYSTCGLYFLKNSSSKCLGIEPQGFFNPCLKTRTFNASFDLIRPTFAELLKCSKGDIYLVEYKRLDIDKIFLTAEIDKIPLERIHSNGNEIYRVKKKVMTKFIKSRLK